MVLPPGLLPQAPNVETKKALLLIDLQNDFVSPDGRLPIQNTANFLPKLPALIRKFRETGPVVWVKTTFRQPCPALSQHTGGFSILLKNAVDHLKHQPIGDGSITVDGPHNEDENAASQPLPSLVEDDAEAFLSSNIPTSQRCCLQATEGAALPAPLTSAIESCRDIVYQKSQYSALADITLVMQLRARMVNDLYVCGSLSNIGVYATVLDAVQQGFGVTIIEDCLGYRDEACHTEAMRRMADDLCADGIDYQELMDDLHGLLGDVIPESRYTRKFQLSMQPESTPGRQLSHSQKVSRWMDTIDSDSDAEKPLASVKGARKEQVLRSKHNVPPTAAAPQQDRSPTPPQIQASPKLSPPRKRSTSDREEAGDTSRPQSRESQDPCTCRTSPKVLAGERSSAKKSKTQTSVEEISSGLPRANTRQFSSAPRNMGQSKSTSQLETSPTMNRKPQPVEHTRSQPNLSTPRSPATAPKQKKKKTKKKAKYDPAYLGPEDKVGEGDCRIVHDIVPPQKADEAFEALKTNVSWQKMYHRSGEVPRLVAVQGTVSTDGAIPIYRHPADESPPLLPFNEAVQYIREKCQKLVGHDLNHVLIQYYRNGDDNISEHSDKTLDIVRGSSVVNVSLGAMRTMTLRTKRGSGASDVEARATPAGPPDHRSAEDGAPRTTQRISLPHASTFILGLHTNANWLHSIRADKRPDSEKSEDELAFDAERISLTFRQIGTFVDPARQMIWGQGATGKTKGEAACILVGAEAEKVGEEMIVRFGRENHLTLPEFNWGAVYRRGFDVVNFVVKEDKG